MVTAAAAAAVVTVRIPGAMRGLTGGSARVEVAGATVGEALDELVAAHPGVGTRLFDGDGRVRRFVNVFVGEEDIRHREGLGTPLEDGAVVSLLPSVAGG